MTQSMMVLPLKLLALFWLQIPTSQPLDLDHCHQGLGAAADGHLEDSAFSASSSYDEASVGPKYARLNGDQNGGAWCSASPVSRDLGSKEYIEVDLGSMHCITGAMTQGRFGNGRGVEFTEAYKLQYWRPGMSDFVLYHDSMGRSILTGNDNTYTVANNTLEPPIFAQKIRLFPYSEHPRTPCVRLDYVGCPFEEGVVSYSIPQGMVRGSTLELMDHTYDGQEDSRTGDLRGGLGQLVDGRYGYDNFKAGSGKKGHAGHLKGYDWLGWKKKTNQAAINLVFAFDQVRTFERVEIHANNHFSKDIQVFKEVKVYFSNEEDKFGDDRYVDFKYMPDLSIENARNVSINLKQEHGQFVMLQLYFNAKWILISEVTFYSVRKIEKPFVVIPGKINNNDNGGGLYQEGQDHVDGDEDGDAGGGGHDVVEVAPIDINVHTYPAAADNNNNNHEHDTTRGEEGNSKTVGIVIGVLLTIITVLLMGILWVVYRSKSSTKEKQRSTPIHSLLTSASGSSASKGGGGGGVGGPNDRFISSLEFKGSHHQYNPHHHNHSLHHPALANIQYTPYNNSSSLLEQAESSQKTSYEDTIYEEPLNTKTSHEHYLSTEDLTDEYAEPGCGSGLHISSSLCDNIYAQANCASTSGSSARKGRFLPPLPLNNYARPLSPTQSTPQPLPSALQSLALPPPPPGGNGNGGGGLATASTSIVSMASTTERRPLLFRNGGCTTPAAVSCSSSSSSSSASPNTKFSTSASTGLEKQHLQQRRPSKSTSISHSRPSTLKKKSKESASNNYYASNDLIPNGGVFDLAKLYAQVNKTSEDQRLQGGSMRSSFKRSTSIDTVNVTLHEIDKEDLQVVQKLGEGQFGEIHLCRIKCANNDGLNLPPYDLDSDLVAVKSLRRHCDEATRSDFEHEARILTSLNDANLLRVLGVCFDTEIDDDGSDVDQAVSIPIGMVCEYTEEGDLCQYLQDHVAETTLTKSPNVPTLSYGSLIYFASQIASGMKYLESLNFVHRDLAARNCLVGPRKSIKICDFGMSRAMYKNDYYKTESGCLLPIRWMAWESLLMGKFTTKSDVWAFGTVLWEILTFAREQPYESQSDAKVLSSLSNMWREGRPTILLQTPHGCPREVRDLMTECWQRDDQERPSFREIHLFLQRKNLGFEPISGDELDSNSIP